MLQTNHGGEGVRTTLIHRVIGCAKGKYSGVWWLYYLSSVQGIGKDDLILIDGPNENVWSLELDIFITDSISRRE